MSRSQNKAHETAETMGYVEELRKAAGFDSEGQFATAADFLPSSFSDWKRGKHVLTSHSLVRLIRAAAARRATAPYEAGEAVSPEVSILRRLAALEAVVAESADTTAASLEALERGIARIEAALPGEDGQVRTAVAR